MKRAIIFGITGQDGSYLAELLLEKGYEVHGIIRRSSSFNTGRIEHIFTRLHLHYGDMTDGSAMRRTLARVQPDEVYNLAAQSHVMVSFEQPEYTHDVVAMGALRLFEACRDVVPDARIYQASSSEMFGDAPAPQSITTPFQPRSPYAVAKLAAHHHARNCRDGYGQYIACGILFNHESPRRGETFVTQKIARAAAEGRPVVLGNLDARRDWGFAGDYVRAMWMMLQRDQPGDFVIATGESHTVREFAELAGAEVQTDARYLRPNEVPHLEGICNLHGWERRVGFQELVRMMVDACRAR